MADLLEKLYPRPEMMRNHWIDLNGRWDFDFDDDHLGERERWYSGSKKLSSEIEVPYVYQSKLSGVGSDELHDVVWYSKRFTLPEDFNGKEIILNFGAVDYQAKVWVNGVYIGEHFGGYTPIKMNITHALNHNCENVIVLKAVDDSFSKEQPRGKQTWIDKPFGCWYTRYTGIWQPVWLDILEKVHIDSFQITPDTDSKKISLKVKLSEITEETELRIKVSFEDTFICNARFEMHQNTLEADLSVENSRFDQGISCWSHEHPNLYDLEFTVYSGGTISDTIKTYFGMRKVDVKDDKILLNGTLVYQKLILNQCYYPDGLVTPKDDEEFIKDIKTIKAMGFNGVRLHQKIENPKFLYWCDRLGLLVWEEMPSAYEFTPQSMMNLTNEWNAVIDRDYSHPCIITWVIFNESWGISGVRQNKQQQAFSQSLYQLTKARDNQRLIIANDGWEHTETDVCTIHDYSVDGQRISKVYKDKDTVVKGAPAPTFSRFIYSDGHYYHGQPVMISEFGGISLDSDDGWGYNGKVKNEDELLERYRSLVSAIRGLDYVCGDCYTQFTDVEQEKNGLLTIDRQFKVNPEKVKLINDI